MVACFCVQNCIIGNLMMIIQVLVSHFLFRMHTHTLTVFVLCTAQSWFAVGLMRSLEWEFWADWLSESVFIKDQHWALTITEDMVKNYISSLGTLTKIFSRNFAFPLKNRDLKRFFHQFRRKWRPLLPDERAQVEQGKDKQPLLVVYFLLSNWCTAFRCCRGHRMLCRCSWLVSFQSSSWLRRCKTVRKRRRPEGKSVLSGPLWVVCWKNWAWKPLLAAGLVSGGVQVKHHSSTQCCKNPWKTNIEYVLFIKWQVLSVVAECLYVREGLSLCVCVFVLYLQALQA